MLTAQEQKTLNYIKIYIEKNGIAPTSTEIASGIGITSRGVVYRYIKSLEQKDYINIIPNKRRNIDVIERDEQRDELTLPFCGKIAAGLPLEIHQSDNYFNIVDRILGENRFILEVDGDSMIGDNICDGDYILCEKTHDIGRNDIAVVVVDNSETTLKRLIKNSDGSVSLVPSNPKTKTLKLSNKRVSIQGRFIGLLRMA